MNRRSNPLVVEHHNGFKDVYVWRGLPGGYNKYETYGFIAVVLFVFILQFIDGIRTIETYLGAFFILMVLGGVYKGFQVGLQSIGYKPYDPKYFTRLTPGFFIWGNDPAVEITSDMVVRVRPVSQDTDNQGVVYVYHTNSRDIIFMAEDDHALEEFATLLTMYYDIEREEDVSE